MLRLRLKIILNDTDAGLVREAAADWRHERVKGKRAAVLYVPH